MSFGVNGRRCTADRHRVHGADRVKSRPRLKSQNERVKLMVVYACVERHHFLSDWGHDFRPDYRRIVRILERLPANVPV